jgi:hypothetical protein
VIASRIACACSARQLISASTRRVISRVCHSDKLHVSDNVLTTSSVSLHARSELDARIGSPDAGRVTRRGPRGRAPTVTQPRAGHASRARVLSRIATDRPRQQVLSERAVCGASAGNKCGCCGSTRATGALSLRRLYTTIMDQRFSTGTLPGLVHRVFHDGAAPSHITFGTQRSHVAHQYKPAGRWPVDQPFQHQRHTGWWHATSPGTADSDELGRRDGGAVLVGPSPLVQMELCASKTPGAPAGMARGRDPPALKAMKVSGSSGVDSNGKLPQSEVNRLCSKLEAVGDKRAAVQHNFVARAVRDAAPAVVRIDAQKKVAVSDATSIFDILFGASGGNSGAHQQRKQIVTGTGSGFCIDSSGIVLTNAHVVEDADSLGIQLHNGKNYKGHVVGMHSELDLAVVKVDVNDDRLPSVCALVD